MILFTPLKDDRVSKTESVDQGSLENPYQSPEIKTENKVSHQVRSHMPLDEVNSMR